jgi:hypothetical protein
MYLRVCGSFKPAKIIGKSAIRKKISRKFAICGSYLRTGHLCINETSHFLIGSGSLMSSYQIKIKILFVD